MKDEQQKNVNEHETMPIEISRVQPQQAKTRRKPVLAKVVKCKRLNVRTMPDGEAPIAGTISESDRVKVVYDGSTNEYYRVVEPIIGFAKKSFLEVK